MKLLYLKLSDFQSYEEAVVHFNEGLIAIAGRNLDASGSNSNGSGKSTIFDAITWALYGKSLRPIGTDEVIRRGRKTTNVSLQFSTGTRQYCVSRSRGEKTALHLRAGDTDCHDLIEDLTQATVAMTQDKINQIVGLDYKTFCAVATFGQDAIRFAGATDKEQKEILERLLGLEVYGQALEKVRAERTKTANDIRLAQQEISLRQDNIASAQDDICRTNALLASETARVAEQNARIDMEVLRLEGEITEAASGLPVIEESIAELDAALKEPSGSSPALDKAISEVGRINAMLSGVSRRQHEVLSQISKLTEERKRAQNRIGRPCGECGRVVTEQELAAVIQKMDRDLIEQEKKQTEIKAEKAALTSELAHWSGEEASAKVAQSEAQEARTLVETERRKLQRDGESLKGEIDSCRVRIASLKREKTIGSRTDFYASELKQTEAKLQQAQTKMNEAVLTCNDLSDKLGYLDFWEKGFGLSGIRSLLMDGVAGKLTEQTNYFLQRLSGGTLWVDITTQTTLKTGESREKFDVKVFNQYGAGSYAGDSAGERQRVDIAIALALHELVRSRAKAPLGFAIFDEVFERMDESGCDNFITLLQKERERFGTIFVVAHNPALAHRFQRVIEVEKKNGVSRIVGGGESGEQCGASEQTSSPETAKSSTRPRRAARSKATTS